MNSSLLFWFIYSEEKSFLIKISENIVDSNYSCFALWMSWRMLYDGRAWMNGLVGGLDGNDDDDDN